MRDSPITIRPGERIAVVGPSGCGKTTLAQALAVRLGYRYVCNDAIIHGSDWQPTPRDERVRRFAAAFDCPAWVIDGNCAGDAIDNVYIRSQIDTLVWLNLPRWEVLPRLLRRTLYRAWTREPLWHGNRESFRLSFASRESILWWWLKTHGPVQAAYAAIFADPAQAHLVRIRLDSAAAANAWLGTLTA